MKKVFLFYPPSKLYQRGEDRSQGNVEDSVATSVRACNDLGYAASMLKKDGFTVFLRDFQTEELTTEELLNEFKKFHPDVVFLSITNSTIFNDLKVVSVLKKELPNIVVILKGALFFNPDKELIDQLDLDEIDYLIGGESDFAINKLLNSHYKNLENIDSVKGILYRKNNDWVKTTFNEWDEDLDSLEFPDRNLMNNDLYVRPDTGEKQATIATSRGCGAACIYCLTPNISGKKVRLRSPINIFLELKDCYENHGIKKLLLQIRYIYYETKMGSRTM